MRMQLIKLFHFFARITGLDFELNSMESNESTTWAKMLPKLMTRRGALTPASGSNSSQRRNSMDSEISYSVRR